MQRQVMSSVVRFLGAMLLISCVASSDGQEVARPAASPALTTLEDEIFAEINRLRSDPAGYAEKHIAPLKERLVRLPKNPEEPFLEFRAFLVGGAEIDYLTLDEGGTEETARAILDETIAALRAAPKLSQLQRNPVLDRSARFYSTDFLNGGKQRDPHVDSLGRKAGARIGSFGGSRSAIAGWQNFVAQLPADATTVARIFPQDHQHYWLAFTGARSYRYWSIPDMLADFIIEHGEAKTLARLDQPGYECVVTVNRNTRTLHHGDAQVAYPFLMPIYGENVAWGSWSPSIAARGMVCWWLLDPGIQDRGHRKMLLDSDYHFAGVGCARSRSVGWVATLDASAEELIEFPAEDVPNR